jgi:hypothetical protein
VSIKEDEYSEYTWALFQDGEIIGVTDNLNKAEKVLRSHFLSDNEWTEEDMGDRLKFDLKFSTWVLIFDRLPVWGYQAYRTPKL